MIPRVISNFQQLPLSGFELFIRFPYFEIIFKVQFVVLLIKKILSFEVNFKINFGTFWLCVVNTRKIQTSIQLILSSLKTHEFKLATASRKLKVSIGLLKIVKLTVIAPSIFPKSAFSLLGRKAEVGERKV